LVAKRIAGLALACKSAKCGIFGIWKAFHFILDPCVNTKAQLKKSWYIPNAVVDKELCYAMMLNALSPA